MLWPIKTQAGGSSWTMRLFCAHSHERDLHVMIDEYIDTLTWTVELARDPLRHWVIDTKHISKQDISDPCLRDSSHRQPHLHVCLFRRLCPHSRVVAVSQGTGATQSEGHAPAGQPRHRRNHSQARRSL